MTYLTSQKRLFKNIIIISGISIVILISLLTFTVSNFLAQNKITSKIKASGCAIITQVNDPGTLSSGQDFTCSGMIDPAFSGSRNIACGWSKNSGWPQTGGKWENATCNGINCTFDIRMDNYSPSTTDIYELVMFDMTTSCGPSTGKRIAISIATSVPTPTSFSATMTPEPTLPPNVTITPGNPTVTPNPTVSPSPTITPIPTQVVCKINSIKDFMTKLLNFNEVNCQTPTPPVNLNCQPPDVCRQFAYLQCNGIWGVCQEGQLMSYPTCVSNCFSIDYRNNNIRPLDKQNIIRYVNAAWPGNRISGSCGSSDCYDYVTNWAINNNWSPAFIIALWIEESGGGTVSQFDFGCGAPSLSQYKGIYNQLDCMTNALTSYSTKPWPEFDCKYSEGHYPCQFTINPYFNGNLKKIYNNVIYGF